MVPRTEHRDIAGDLTLDRRQLLTLGGTGLAMMLAGCRQKAATTVVTPGSSPETAETRELQRIRRTVLTYLTDERFAGNDLLQKMYPGAPVKLERHYVDVRALLFSMRDEDFRGEEETFGTLLNNPKSARFAQAKDGNNVRFKNTRPGEELPLTIGGTELTYSGLNRYLFSAKDSDLRVEPDTPVTYNRLGIDYDITPREMDGFLSNERIYRGYANIVRGRRVTVNFGSRVARPQEPSLTRLAKRIVSPNDTAEVKLQKLVTFVANGIPYSHRDVEFEDATGLELVKRPNEVLMTGEGDCASKALALASLYEQEGLEYWLLYIVHNPRRAGHLTLLVPGNFPDENNMSFKVGGKSHTISDPTVPNFVIGKTRLRMPIELQDMTYVQRPKDGAVYDPKTGELVREGKVE